MLQRSDWAGLVAGKRAAGAECRVVALLQQSRSGGSGAFLGQCDDGRRYWLKVLNNGQGPRVPITEQIVARAGRMIDAPVCEVRTASIGATLAGWEFRRGRVVEPGIAHASLAVQPCVEVRAMQRRSDDSNARRHLGIMALYDWCWGSDPQWLINVDQDGAFYSHDHGWYLPPRGAGWSEAAMMASVGLPNEFKDPGGGILAQDVLEIAEKLKSVQREAIADALRTIPQEWPVDDQELECVGFFLESRACGVAQRLIERFGVKS